MKTIIPERLRKGDTVGIVSPSGNVAKGKHKERTKQFMDGVKRLESWGLKVKYNKAVFAEHWYSGGTREQRIRDFNSIWKDPKVKMVIMSQGGYTANQTLDGIDYGMIRKNPKMFVGFSDGTTLVNAIYAKTGLMTYMGPDLMWTFGKPMDKAVEDNLRRTFFEGKVGEIKPNPDWKHRKDKKMKKPGWKCLRPGKASGTLVGGHVGVVCGNMLAGYFPDTKNKIMILEGTEGVDQTDWYLHAMRLNGSFNGLKGMILGFFDGSKLDGMKNQPSVPDVVLEATKDYKFPILQIAELGHNLPNFAFPIGGRVTIDAKKRFLSVDGRTAR